MKTTLILFIAAGFVLPGNLAWAQRDAASKIDGAAYEAPYFYDTTQMYQQNAYGHAQVLAQATRSGEAVPQAVLQEHTGAIRANLQAASKHHANLRSAVKSRPAAAKQLDAVDAHHKKALAHTSELEASGGDAAKAHKLSSSLSTELKAAHETHKKLADPLTSKKAAKN